jgi:hypothetical protein
MSTCCKTPVQHKLITDNDRDASLLLKYGYFALVTPTLTLYFKNPALVMDQNLCAAQYTYHVVSTSWTSRKSLQPGNFTPI